MSVDPQDVLKDYIVKHGLKASRQREVIVEVFFKADDHISVEELLVKARKADPKVSQATVYRTMKLLTDCGLARPHNFQDNQTRYEVMDVQHHDHLICEKCGKISEFVDEKIEALQEAIARKHGFLLKHHKMELYGLCRDCKR
jgi:Fur family transcriptional regulator, ferric uptake regulator